MHKNSFPFRSICYYALHWLMSPCGAVCVSLGSTHPRVQEEYLSDQCEGTEFNRDYQILVY